MGAVRRSWGEGGITLTFAAASPGGLRSVDRFVLVGGAWRWGRVSGDAVLGAWSKGGGDGGIGDGR